MNRQQAEALLVDYLYGELAPADRAAFETYVATDAEFAAELKGFEQVRAVVRDVAQEEPPLALSERLVAEAARQVQAAAPSAAEPTEPWLARFGAMIRSLCGNPAFAVATTIAIVVGVTLIAYEIGGPDSKRMAESDVAATARSLGYVGKREAALPAKDQAKGAPLAEKRVATEGAPEALRPTAVSARSPKKVARRKARGAGTAGGARAMHDASRGRAKSKVIAKREAQGASDDELSDLIDSSMGARRAPAAAPPRPTAKKAPADGFQNATAEAPRAAPTARSRRPASAVAEEAPAAEDKERRAVRQAKAASSSPRLASSETEVAESVDADAKADEADVGHLVDLGSQAVQDKDCSRAMGYYSRAYELDTSVLGAIYGALGTCREQLATFRETHPQLVEALQRLSR